MLKILLATLSLSDYFLDMCQYRYIQLYFLMKKIPIHLKEYLERQLTYQKSQVTDYMLRYLFFITVGFWAYTAGKIIILLILQTNLYKSPQPYLFGFALPLVIYLLGKTLLKYFANYNIQIIKATIILTFYFIIAYYLIFNTNDRTIVMHTTIIILLLVQFNLFFVGSHFKILNQSIIIIFINIAASTNSINPFDIYEFIENSIFIFLLLIITRQYNQEKGQEELKFNDFLDNIPTAICILNDKAEEVLYQNSSVKEFMQDKNGNCQVLEYFKSICITLEELKLKFPNVNFDEQEDEDFASESSTKMVDLQSVLNKIISFEKDDTYQFRCEQLSTNLSNSAIITDRKIIDVKIKKGLAFEGQKSILITLYDVSTHLQSTYYQNLNTFKSRLIKSISHELRTRLNIIQGMISVLINQKLNLDAGSKMLLQASYNNCRIQTYIIGGIIDYNLLQENQIAGKFSKVSIKQLVLDAISLFQEEAEMKKITINLQNNMVLEKQAQIDQEKFMVCLVNILSNSVKFTSQNGVINIVLSIDNYVRTPQQSYKKNLNYSSNQRISLKSLNKSFNKISSENQSEKFNNSKMIFRVRSNKSKRSSVITSRKNSNLPQRYKISIQDTGIGVREQKLLKIQNIIQGKDDLENYSRDSSDGYMMGLRVVQKLLNYVNCESGQWCTIDSFENHGTTVVLYLKVQNLNVINSYQISCIHSDPNLLIESIEDEGHVSRTNCMMSFNHASHMQINIHEVGGFEAVTFDNQRCRYEEEILIVDDEPYNLLILEQLFKCLNQKVVKADNGKQALDIVAERIQKVQRLNHECKIFKAIIMDYQMPLMNGEVATKEIIKLCYNCNILTIPIFGCTGFSSSEDIQTLISSGMKEVFTKPITKQNLEEILSRLNMGEFKEAFIISPNYQCDNVDLEEKLI